MLRKLMPLVFLAAGAGGGIGAALVLAPPPGDTPAAAQDGTGHDPALQASGGDGPDRHGTAEARDYVKLANQFVIPVVRNDRIEALVVLTLSLETAPGLGETVYAREPKLRDAFLRVLFDHANTGGFRGAFTQADRLDPLRTALREAARAELGRAVRDVLIVDIVRQDG